MQKTTTSTLRSWKFARRHRWRWLLPLLLLLLFLALLAWLPWQSQRVETGERQEQLIADTLWLEQTISFQLAHHDEVLHLLGHDIVQQRLGQPQVLARLQQLVQSNPEIERIDWLDAGGNLLASTLEAAPGLYLDQAMEKGTNKPTNQATNQATSKASSASADLWPAAQDGKSRCLPPAMADKQWLLACHIPLLKERQLQGRLVVRYQLQTILEKLVPWWFAQENQISLLDVDDKVLAERAAGGPGRGVYTHWRALDLSGLTLTLRANSTRSEPKLWSNLLVLSVLLLSLGLAWSLAALWRDINRRLAAEVALRQQVAFRTAMENSVITGLRARDLDGRLTYVNPAFCKMVGFPPEQLLARPPPMPYWAPEAIEMYQARFASILAGSVPSNGYETFYLRANGERFPVLIHESPLVDEHGKQTGWMSSILDISELKHAQELTRAQQEKLDTSARLATVGEIGSMLAHELNQPLAAIASYTTGAMNMIAAGKLDPALLSGALKKASDQAQRAGTIIRSVHEFVRKREARREWLDIGELITTILPLVELQAKTAHVPVQCKIASDLPPVSADKTLLEQVLLNLTRNAIEAMSTCPLAQRQLGLLAVRDGDMLRVDVVDRGLGISADHAAKLFTPFFSTKQNGMGMGLNVCRTAIEFHGGRLEHRPNPAGGTIFSFSLPLTVPATSSNGTDTADALNAADLTNIATATNATNATDIANITTATNGTIATDFTHVTKITNPGEN